MQTKADVQRRVFEFLAEKRWSMRKLALVVGVPPSTLARMMEDNPTYQGEPGPWIKLAQYRELGLDEAEVLAALDLGPAIVESGTDPWALLDAAMRGLRLRSKYRAHIRRQVEFLLEANQVKPFWSYLGTNTQWPPQLPGRAFAPPFCTTSHTSCDCAVTGRLRPM